MPAAIWHKRCTTATLVRAILRWHAHTSLAALCPFGNPDRCTPYGFRVLKVGTCSYTAKSSTIHDESSYVHSLKVDAKIEGTLTLVQVGPKPVPVPAPLVKGSFSASTDYQTMKSGTDSGTKAYVATSATCNSPTKSRNRS